MNLIEAHLRNVIQHLRSEHKKGEEKEVETILPTHIEIGPQEGGLKEESLVLTEQIRTIDKSRLKEKIGHIENEEIISKINNALGVSFGLE